MKKAITIGECSEALSKLQHDKGYRYHPSDQEILDEAIRLRNRPWFEKFNEWAVDALGIVPNMFFKMCILVLILIELESELGHKYWMHIFIVVFALWWVYQDIQPWLKELLEYKEINK